VCEGSRGAEVRVEVGRRWLSCRRLEFWKRLSSSQAGDGTRRLSELWLNLSESHPHTAHDTMDELLEIRTVVEVNVELATPQSPLRRSKASLMANLHPQTSVCSRSAEPPAVQFTPLSMHTFPFIQFDAVHSPIDGPNYYVLFRTKHLATHQNSLTATPDAEM
jgi:hypothetical protein